MMDLLKDEFPSAAVISIGRRDTLGAYHRRQLVPAPAPSADASP
jgi:ABC-type uncharacterized transport system fused permease/ATPase subunit